MTVRFLVFLLVFCTSCHSGIIPCPEAKGVRLKRSHAKRVHVAERANTVTASAKETTPTTDPVRYRHTRPALEHVDVEEWDCPKPGAKYMPKEVKENIKKNARKMKSHYKNRNEADSLNTTVLPSYLP
jgi:hypothetical protein